MTQQSSELFAECRRRLGVGSKSFSFAARIFDAQTHEATTLLYAWCRACDDAIDEAQDTQQALARLCALRELTHKALAGDAADLDVPFRALAQVAQRYAIPSVYFFELLEGMAMDVRGHSYVCEADLTLYCYRVAGVVGAMMAHIMGISDTKALDAAVALGIAFQMTNIARDVLDDYALGRIYLPKTWRDEIGLPDEAFASPQARAKLAQLAARLVDTSTPYYRQAMKGLLYLRWRHALCIGVARYVYGAIGTLVRLRGVRAWDRRVVVPTWFKCLVAVRAVLVCTLLRPWRLHRSLAPQRIAEGYDASSFCRQLSQRGR